MGAHNECAEDDQLPGAPRHRTRVWGAGKGEGGGGLVAGYRHREPNTPAFREEAIGALLN